MEMQSNIQSNTSDLQLDHEVSKKEARRKAEQEDKAAAGGLSLTRVADLNRCK
jgi:hypothetical protein